MINPIVINNFQKGTSTTPFLTDGAIGKSVNCDAFGYPGVIRGSNKLTLKYSIPSAPYLTVRDPITGYIYVLAFNGHLYLSTTAGLTWAESNYDPVGSGKTFGTGQGLYIWKRHLFIAKSDKIDVLGLSSSPAPGWTYDWKSITANTLSHPFISLKNAPAYLHFGNDAYMGYIQETTTFNASDAGTYNFETAAMKMPSNYTVSVLSELGNNVLIGSNGMNAIIVVWNGTSTNYQTAINVNEENINAMKNIGDVVYVSAGYNGKFFSFTESGLQFIGKIPLSHASSQLVPICRDALCSLNGRLYVGVSGYDPTTADTLISGVYSFNGSNFICENIASNNSLNQNYIRTLFALSGNELLVGWDFLGSPVAYGIDYLDIGNYYSAYTSYFESLFYRVGTKFAKANLALEMQLSKPMVAGDGIRIKYRTKLTDDWVTVSTIDYTNFGDIQSYSFGNILTGVENFQLKVEFSGSTELLELMLIPS